LILSNAVLTDTVIAKSDYPSKTIRIICPYSPGGGYDRQARGIAPFLQKHLPNNVSVIVENIRGAGSLMAAHNVWKSKPDGYRIYQSPVSANMIDEFLNPKEVQLKMAEFEWIGQYTRDIRAIGIHPKMKINTWEELMERSKKKPIKFGTGGVSSSQAREGGLIAAMTGLKLRFIHYQGSKDTQAAMARGEIEMTQLSFTSMMRWGDDIRIFVLWNDERHPLIPDVPTAVEIGVPKDIYEKSVSLPVVGSARALAVAPGTPPQIMNTLRKAFNDSMADPEYKAWLKKVKQLHGPIIEGKDFRSIILSMQKALKENRDLIKQVVK
jgi:tripartite-type tricarboxylate transporter receptor subunit TctC